jgi:hypothetical protein
MYANIIEGGGLIVGGFPDDARRLCIHYEGDGYQLFTYDDDSDFVGISATYPIPNAISRAVALRKVNASTMTCSTSDAHASLRSLHAIPGGRFGNSRRRG